MQLVENDPILASQDYIGPLTLATGATLVALKDLKLPIDRRGRRHLGVVEMVRDACCGRASGCVNAGNAH